MLHLLVEPREAHGTERGHTVHEIDIVMGYAGLSHLRSPPVLIH